MQAHSKSKKPPKGVAGHEGRFEIGTRVVEDPYEKGAKLRVAMNVRHDVLIQWHSRHQIEDADFAAGRRFQAIYARAEIGGAAAIRYDKPKVDGGYPVDPLSEKVMEARQELSGLSSVLGLIDYPLLCRVVGEGVSIENEALRWPGGDPQRYVARRVRDALTNLAGHWGTRGKVTHLVRGQRASPVEGEEYDEKGRLVEAGQGHRWGKRDEA